MGAQGGQSGTKTHWNFIVCVVLVNLGMVMNVIQDDHSWRVDKCVGYQHWSSKSCWKNVCQLQRLGTQRCKGRKLICNSLLSFYTVLCTFFNILLIVCWFSRCLHQFCTEKNIPFHDFLHFSTTKPLVSTSFVAHDDTFPLFSPVFPPENLCFSPFLNQFCSSECKTAFFCSFSAQSWGRSS